MSYTKRITSFHSSDGKNTVHAELYIPDGEVRGVVLLSHGMIDYVGRYTALAEYLTSHGFVFAGNDHLGHGETAASPDDYGYFAERDGYKLVINDLYKMNRLVRAEFPSVPTFLFGHSMGSFLARLYTVEYPDSIDGVIIHGTGGKNPLLPLGKAVISLTRAFRGGHHRSKLVKSLAFGSYNDHFDKSEGSDAWLTRDIAAVASRPTDPHTSYIFTAAGYADLFTMIGECNSKAHFASFPKDIPTLVISGEDDPVGGYGKGVRFVYDSLVGAGVKNTSLKTYAGARHELFNETNKDEVFADILAWLTEAMAEK
jgi:alpha-beta hydrolase superfamily lysophospholipase